MFLGSRRFLSLQDVGAPSKRRAAVVTLGQICQSAGCVMTPYWDFPQLLALLLRLLHEGNPSKGRCEVMRVLGKWQQNSLNTCQRFYSINVDYYISQVLPCESVILESFYKI
jgi:hypothetical protein